MNHKSKYSISPDLPIASLLERFYSCFSNLYNDLSTDSAPSDPMLKMHCLVSVCDVYEYVRRYFVNRSRRLKEYFSDNTLKHCLECVREIEDLSNSIESFQSALAYRDFYDGCGISDKCAKTLDLVVEDNIDNLIDEVDADLPMPSVSKSFLWAYSQSRNESKIGTFHQVFREAREDALNAQMVKSSPIKSDMDKPYIDAMQKNELGNRIAIHVRQPQPFFASDSSFALLPFMKTLISGADQANTDVIFCLALESLEKLRNVFMTEAEDIFYIRTGKFDNLKELYDEAMIELYYTKVPFDEYNKRRQEFAQYYPIELEESFEYWCEENHIVERQPTIDERLRFLNEKRESIVSEMKQNTELWKIRLRSGGGLDTPVTPQSFARMFYKRGNHASYFIDLQWGLEMVTEELAKHETILQKKPRSLSPEETAVNDLIAKVAQLVTNVHEKWNGKMETPGVHEAEVKVEIKREELLAHLNDCKQNHFDQLLEICYPKSAKTNRKICEFVATLYNEGYFGKLTKDHLAEALNPIVGLTSTKNYLR